LCASVFVCDPVTQITPMTWKTITVLILLTLSRNRLWFQNIILLQKLNHKKKSSPFVFFSVFVHWNNLKVFVNAYHKCIVGRSCHLFIFIICTYISLYTWYYPLSPRRRMSGFHSQWCGTYLETGWRNQTTAREIGDRVKPHNFFCTLLWIEPMGDDCVSRNQLRDYCSVHLNWNWIII